MKLAIVGGALQGMEAVYLSKKAGFRTFVIDRRENAPALSLADDHAVLDPVISGKEAMRIFEGCDAVLPACENLELLCKLEDILSSSSVPLLFDIDSYKVSSSKSASNILMGSAGIPIPKGRGSGYPAVVKPSSQSGSAGIRVAYNENDISEGVQKILNAGDEPVVQEFVSGKNVSLEIIGNGKEYRPFVTTEILLSKDYDCKRVICSPGILTAEKEEDLKEIAVSIAKEIGLTSLMDIEAVDTKDGLRILEIDARIPSQTPAAVLAATGMNILKEMVFRKFGETVKIDHGASSYEHFLIKDGKMMTCGEKEFSGVRGPRIVSGLFGSDEMITDYDPEKGTWTCAMINRADSEEKLERKRSLCIGKIMNECGIDEFSDESPEMIR
ncbi:MAG: 3-methylornithine--L-lysine ligase PylC [Methanomassiliicoccaceae archaeon]|nr:3-methylornithine--L-lysine ligase PylC [Methanomassiliicoccaceae archaeon]